MTAVAVLLSKTGSSLADDVCYCHECVCISAPKALRRSLPPCRWCVFLPSSCLISIFRLPVCYHEDNRQPRHIKEKKGCSPLVVFEKMGTRNALQIPGQIFLPPETLIIFRILLMSQREAASSERDVAVLELSGSWLLLLLSLILFP